MYRIHRRGTLYCNIQLTFFVTRLFYCDPVLHMQTNVLHVALSTASEEAVWLRRLLENFLKKQDDPTELHEGN